MYIIHKTYADNATVIIAGIIASQYPVCFDFITSCTMAILTAAAK